jgi:hypothetical protein
MHPVDARFRIALNVPAAMAVLLLLGGCVSGVPVSVSNGSSEPLTQVTVSGKGFSESMGRIAPGATETINIRPRTATKVRVAFEAAGQRYAATTEDEIENDTINTVKLIVGADFSLVIETPLR